MYAFTLQGTSKFRGVSWHKSKQKWMSRIRLQGQHINNTFDSEEAAAHDYDHRVISRDGRCAYSLKIHCWPTALKRFCTAGHRMTHACSSILHLLTASVNLVITCQPTVLHCSKAMLNFPLATYAAEFSEAELDAIDARVAAGKPPPLTGTAGGLGQGPMWRLSGHTKSIYSGP